MTVGILDAVEVLPARTLLSAASTEVSALAFCEPIDWSETECPAPEPSELPEPETAVVDESVASMDESSAELLNAPSVESQFPEIIACALEPGLEIPVSTPVAECQVLEKPMSWIPESTDDVNAAAENSESLEIWPEGWIQAESFCGGDSEQPNVLLATMRGHEAETGDPSDENLSYWEFSDACSTREPPELLLDKSGHAESAWVDPSVGMPVFPDDVVLVRSGTLLTSPEVDETTVSDGVENPDELPLSYRQRGAFVVLPADVSDDVVLAGGESLAVADELESLTPVVTVAMRSSTLASESGTVPKHFRIPVPRFSPPLLPVLQATPFSLRDPVVADTRQFARVTDTVAHRESPSWTAVLGSAGEFIRPVPGRKWHRADKDVSSKQASQLDLLKSSRRTPPAEMQPEREVESDKPFEDADPADVTQASSDDTAATAAGIPVENAVENTVQNVVVQNP